MTYIEPEIRVVRMAQDVVCTSVPGGVHNEYKAGEGLAPERKGIWN